MQRDLVLIAVLFVLCTNTDDVDGKICPSLDIRTTQVAGEAARLHRHHGPPPRRPHRQRDQQQRLRKLLFSQTDGDRGLLDGLSGGMASSLGDLFPNLRIIRGNQLFLNFALVVYRMPHLPRGVLFVIVVVRCGHAVVQRRALDASGRITEELIHRKSHSDDSFRNYNRKIAVRILHKKLFFLYRVSRRHYLFWFLNLKIWQVHNKHVR
jgi:hypothetical protein